MDIETPKEYLGDNFTGTHQPYEIKTIDEQEYNQRDYTYLLRYCQTMAKEGKFVKILEDEKRKQLIIMDHKTKVPKTQYFKKLMRILTTHARDINRELEPIEVSILFSTPNGEIQPLHTDYNFTEDEDRPKRYFGIWVLQDGTKIMGQLNKSSLIPSEIPLKRKQLFTFRNDFVHAGGSFPDSNFRIHVIFGKKGDMPNNEIGILQQEEQEVLYCRGKKKGCPYTATNKNTLKTHHRKCTHCFTEEYVNLTKKRDKWGRQLKDTFFEQLVKYYDENKHCRVKESENKALFDFCQVIRKHEAILTIDMKKKLKKVKFFYAVNR